MSIQQSEEEEDKVSKALGDKTRRKILDCLQEKPITTGDLCEKFRELDRCTVMLHLGILEKADLVLVRREGRHRWNHVNVEPIHAIYRRWIKKYAETSVNLLVQLKEDLETTSKK